eukprot:8040909-Pyramimonas_sp.AAC.1
MATWLSEFAARSLSACAVVIFPVASPLHNSCTSGSTAPVCAMATWLSKFRARFLNARAA